MDDTRTTRTAGVLRDIARGGLSGLIAGVVVGGVGGRIVMAIIAQLNPDAFGMVTEAGEVIGRFTVPGTIALIVFGGMSAGLVGAVLWVVVSPWVRGTGARKSLLAMPIAVALGTFILVESTNFDFEIVGPTWLVLVLLIGLVALTGAATAWLDDRLDRLLPRPVRPGRGVALYGLVALLGTPALLITMLAFFDPGFSNGPTPFGVGPALLVPGVATAIWWALRIRDGRTMPPRALVLAGQIGLLVAVAFGFLHLWTEIGKIYAAQ
ncbi:MAG: hypothetical protein ABIZ52_03605 [Candidatus Limnocylindrales bacterium]